MNADHGRTLKAPASGWASALRVNLCNRSRHFENDSLNLGAGFACNPTESQSRRPAAKVYRIVAKSGVVVFRPKGPAVQIAWPSGPGKAVRGPAPPGQAIRTDGPLGRKLS